MTINIIITDAGRAEVINAENTGTAPVTIAEIGFGTGQYNPAVTDTALQAEFKRITTFGGATLATMPYCRVASLINKIQLQIAHYHPPRPGDILGRKMN